MKYPVALIALCICLPLAAAELSDEGIMELDAYLEQAVNNSKVPGLVALVVDRDGVLYEQAFGQQDVGEGREMRKDSIFRLASMGKAITSTVLMMLVEEGKVELDAPVSDYLPELADPQVFSTFDPQDASYTSRPAAGEMTIRQLLTHTSGLGYGFTSERLNQLTGGDFNVSATDFPLLFDPGTQWHYGESTRVLGHVVEKVSGEELAAFMQRRLLRPLGMTDTTYDVPAENNDRVVTIHQSNGSALVELPNPEGVISAPHYGDGGLSGTAADYGRFIRMFLNGGMLEDSGSLLSPETVELMGQNHTAPVTVQLMHSTNPLLSENFPLGAGVDSYGLGFQRTGESSPGLRPTGSLSWAGIYNTEFWIDPVNGIGAVLLMQYLPFYDADALEVLQGFERRIYSELQP